MNPETDESLWQRIAAAFFGGRKMTDERLFTSRVMAEIRQLHPAASPWRLFVRWAAPALVLSMASFTVALTYSVRPDAVSAETLLLEDPDPGVSDEWLSAPSEEEPYLNPEVKS